MTVSDDTNAVRGERESSLLILCGRRPGSVALFNALMNLCATVYGYDKGIKDNISNRWLLSSEIHDKLIIMNTGKGDSNMTQVVQESVKMLEMLPESEQELANQLIKRIVLAWDPDYTKLTPDEKKRLEEAEQRIDNGDYVRDNEIDW